MQPLLERRRDEPIPLKSRLGGRPAWLLAGASLTLHLLGLSHPPTEVFDEVQLGKYVSAYTETSRRTLGPSPPHGKLLLSGMAALFGYRPGESAAAPGERYRSKRLWVLRLLPAAAGAILPILAFLFLRQLGTSTAAAFFGGLCVLLENARLLQSRMATEEPLLLVGAAASLCLLAAGLKARSPFLRLPLFASSGVMAALAAGTRLLGWIALWLAVTVVVAHARKSLSRGWLKASLVPLVCLFLGFLSAYGGGWLVHFRLLDQPGPSDAQFTPTGDLATDTLKAHIALARENHRLARRTGDGPRWTTLPLTPSAPRLYWAESFQRLWLAGNPVVWLGTAAVFVSLLVTAFLRGASRLQVERPRQSQYVLWIPCLGFAFSYLSLAFHPGALTPSHYFLPLLYSVLASTLWLDSIGWTRSGGLGAQRRSFYVAVGAVIGAFLILSPVTFGYRPLWWHQSLLAIFLVE